MVTIKKKLREYLIDGLKARGLSRLDYSFCWIELCTINLSDPGPCFWALQDPSRVSLSPSSPPRSHTRK
jgi:hypothetical protein